jgi:hypothetical protein
MMDPFSAPVLRYVVDEDSRGVLWRAIRRHNGSSSLLLDARRVGDEPDLPLGTEDPQILTWAERENRVVVSADRKTLVGHLAAHLKAGHHSPGLFIVLPGARASSVVWFLMAAAYASEPGEWRDRVSSFGKRGI